MAVASRVFRRFLEHEAAHRVVGRFVRAMSDADAKRVLGLPRAGNPSDADIIKRYRTLVRETIQSDPDAAITQDALKDLNIAKDTLLGQFDSKRPGDPNAPEGPARTRRKTDFDPEDEVKREPAGPPPVPEGEPFTAALHGLGNVDWKIATDGTFRQNYLIEDASERPPKGYWVYSQDVILLGKTASHYVFAKLTRRTHTRGDSRDKTAITRWVSVKHERPIGTYDLLKLAPKAISALREGANRRAKFTVLENALTEERLVRLRGTLSLPDAIVGAGMLDDGSAPKGRKVQVEIEPVLNEAKYRALRADPIKKHETHLAYDWFLYINGKRYGLTEREVEGLKKHYLLISVFSYDYTKGKVNLTRLKGGRMKMGPKDSLEAVAKSLDPGPLRDAIAAAAESFT